jgi:hypothetical protein
MVVAREEPSVVPDEESEPQAVVTRHTAAANAIDRMALIFQLLRFEALTYHALSNEYCIRLGITFLALL